MPKAKLKFDQKDEKKFKVAANVANVDVNNSYTVGGTFIAEVIYRDANSLVELGRSMDKYNGNELDVINGVKEATPSKLKAS